MSEQSINNFESSSLKDRFSSLKDLPVSSDSISAVSMLIHAIFDDIAYISDDVLETNTKMAQSGGFSRSDRVVSANLCNYLLDNIASIYAGLVMSSDISDDADSFLKSCCNAVEVELNIDELTNPEDVVKARRITKAKARPSIYSNSSCYCIDFGKYNNAVYNKMVGKISKSFDILIPCSELISMGIDKLTPDQMTHIGFCISNYMYFLRAFAKDEVFANLAISYIDHFKKCITDTNVNINKSIN